MGNLILQCDCFNIQHFPIVRHNTIGVMFKWLPLPLHLLLKFFRYSLFPLIIWFAWEHWALRLLWRLSTLNFQILNYLLFLEQVKSLLVWICILLNWRRSLLGVWDFGSINIIIRLFDISTWLFMLIEFSLIFNYVFEPIVLLEWFCILHHFVGVVHHLMFIFHHPTWFHSIDHLIWNIVYRLLLLFQFFIVKLYFGIWDNKYRLAFLLLHQHGIWLYIFHSGQLLLSHEL